MQTAKKKRIIIAAAASVLAVAMTAAGVTMAYLTTSTEERANNFTFGNAKIELLEESWEDSSSHVIYPGEVTAKNPKVKNIGETDLYAYIEVKIPRAKVKMAGNDNVTVKEENADLFELVNLNTTDWVLIKDNQTDNDYRVDEKDNYHVQLYAYIQGKEPGVVSSNGGETSCLFEKVKYSQVIEGQLEEGQTMEMPVNAYAIQDKYLQLDNSKTLAENMKDAFDKYSSELVN